MPLFQPSLSPETEAIEKHSVQVAEKILAIKSHYHSQELATKAAVDQQRGSLKTEIQDFQEQINTNQHEIASREQALDEIQHGYDTGAEERAKLYSAALREQLSRSSTFAVRPAVSNGPFSQTVVGWI